MDWRQCVRNARAQSGGGDGAVCPEIFRERQCHGAGNPRQQPRGPGDRRNRSRLPRANRFQTGYFRFPAYIKKDRTGIWVSGLGLDRRQPRNFCDPSSAGG